MIEKIKDFSEGKFSYFEFNEEKKNILFLLHGLGDRGSVFYKLSQDLPDFHIIAIDLPGHGKSTSISLYDFAVTWVHEAIETFGYSKYDLGGHSLGGMIAAIYCGTYKKEVKHCILIDGGYNDMYEIMEYVKEKNITYLFQNEEEQLALYENGYQEVYDSFADFYKEQNAFLQMDSPDFIAYCRTLGYEDDEKFHVYLKKENIKPIILWSNEVRDIENTLDYVNSSILLLVSNSEGFMSNINELQAIEFQKMTKCYFVLMKNMEHNMHIQNSIAVANTILDWFK